VPALVDSGALEAAAAHWELADAPHPYFRPELFLLLYVRVPLAVVSSFALFLLPGVLLLPGDGDRASLPLRRFTAALCWNAVLVALAAVVVPDGGRGGIWALFALLACIPLALQRLRRPAASPVTAGLGWMPPVAAAVVLLVPKLVWESFNGDGAHAYESVRLLLDRVAPFFPPEAGPLDGFPGPTSFAFAYPGVYFLRLFGDVEAAARVPALLYLVGLHGAVFAAAGAGRVAVTGAGARLRAPIVAGCCAVYLLAMAFSASYSPYMADIALPPTQDTLLLAVFLGFVWATVAGRWGWALLFAAWTHASLPSGLLLMALFVVARRVTDRKRPWGPTWCEAGTIAAVLVAAKVLPAMLSALGLPSPGGEYSAGNLRERLEFVQVAHVARFAWAAVPGGIVAFAALFAWKRQDRVARALTLVVAGYFVFFYVQAHVSLHHFVPAMILPWVVLLRLPAWESAPAARRLAGLTAAGIVVATVLAWPANTRPFVASKRIVARMQDATTARDPARPGIFVRTQALAERLPRTVEQRVPDEALGVAPNVWATYLADGRGAESEPVYRLVDDGAGDVAVEVLDEEAAQRIEALRPPTDTSAPLLRAPRSMLFRHLPNVDGPRFYDLGWHLRRIKRSLLGTGSEED